MAQAAEELRKQLEESQRQLKLRTEETERYKKAAERARKESEALKLELETTKKDKDSEHATIMQMRVTRESMLGNFAAPAQVVVPAPVDAKKLDKAVMDKVPDQRPSVALGELPHVPVVVSGPTLQDDAVAIAEKKAALKAQQMQRLTQENLILGEQLRKKSAELSATESKLRETQQAKDALELAKNKEIEEVAKREQLAATRLSESAAALEQARRDAQHQSKLAAEKLDAKEKELNAVIAKLTQEKETVVAELQKIKDELEEKSLAVIELEREIENTAAELAKSRQSSIKLTQEKLEQADIFREELKLLGEKYKKVADALEISRQQCARYQGALAGLVDSPQKPAVATRLERDGSADVVRVNLSDTFSALDVAETPVVVKKDPVPIVRGDGASAVVARGRGITPPRLEEQDSKTPALGRGKLVLRK